jgi:hypothetical protein
MLALSPTHVVDAEQRRKSVLLPFSQWKRIVKALEELDDIRAYDVAKAGSAETLPFEQAVCEIQEGYRG